MTGAVPKMGWIITGAFVWALQSPALGQVACPQPLSGGTPPVNAQHIFCGEINNSGKAVGFHSRPGGKNPESVSGTPEPRNDPHIPGVYTLSQFHIAQGGRGAVKALSTLYPDHCSAQDVIAAIQHAYITGIRGDNSFNGPSGPTCTDNNGKPFRIQGYTGMRNGRIFIITGFPNP